MKNEPSPAFHAVVSVRERMNPQEDENVLSCLSRMLAVNGGLRSGDQALLVLLSDRLGIVGARREELIRFALEERLGYEAEYEAFLQEQEEKEEMRRLEETFARQLRALARQLREVERRYSN